MHQRVIPEINFGPWFMQTSSPNYEHC